MVFIRKIVLILCCISVFVAMAVPTLAVGGSGATDIEAFPVLVFNSIEYETTMINGYPASVSFQPPWNSGYVGQSSWEYSYGENGSVAYGHVGVGINDYGDEFVTSMIMPYASPNIGVAQEIEFKAGQQIVFLEELHNGGKFAIEKGEGLYIERVYVHGTYNYVKSENDGVYDRYVGITNSFSTYVYADGIGGAFNIGEAIYQTLQGVNEWNIVFFNTIEIDITFRRTDSNTSKLWVYMPVSSAQWPNANENFHNWLIQYNPIGPSPETQGSIGQFLKNTVNSFFTMEIWPGFSMSHIFTMVVAVCVLLWFIKLIR